MVNKRTISDQVLFRIYGGDVDIASPVQKLDVFKATEQLINSIFKLEQFSQNLPSGETIPHGSMIATYTDVAVSAYGDIAKANLPIQPISLPKNIGVFDVRPALSLTTIQNKQSFIPLARGQRELLRVDNFLSDLLGQVGYEVRNTDVVFTKNIALYGVTKVDFELVVFDMSLYSETDILPIPSSMEQDIIDKLYQMFKDVKPESPSNNQLTA
jgi:hypothetical protein